MKNSKELSPPPEIRDNNLLKAACITFLIILIFFFLVELTDRTLFRSKSIFARSVADFERHKSEVEMLFLGQSDIQFSMIPHEFQSRAFNFAGSGESLVETYYKLKHYISDMPELKTVVLTVTLPSFSSYRANEIQWEYFARGYIKGSDLRELYALKGSVAIKEKLLSYAPVIKRIEMMDFLMNLNKFLRGERIDKTEMVKGYLKHTGSNISEEKTIKRVQRQFEGQTVYDDYFLLYLEKILKLCNEHNVQVVTVTLPLPEIYMSYAEKYTSENSLYETVLNNPRFSRYIVKHVDFLNDVSSAEDEIFLNQDHLNYTGAVKYSRLLSSEISSLTN